MDKGQNGVLHKLVDKTVESSELCFGCVYFPPNLPRQRYAADDWDMLQQRSCSFEHRPGDAGCQASRKTSCSLVDLSTLNASMTRPTTADSDSSIQTGD